MATLYEKLDELAKAINAGGYDAAPSTLRQGPALQVEDCSPIMTNVTFSDKHIKLQKELTVKGCKSTFVQFNRRLSYGQFGGSAQIEGAVGAEQTSDYVRVGVPMAFYSEVRRTTMASNMVATQTGEKPEGLESEAAALRLAGDIEFDVFRGKADFSNAGVFDSNPLAIPALPNMMGLDCQVRQSDLQINTQDLMFEAWGAGLSVVIAGGAVLNQGMIEDASVRSAMNHGSADTLYVDPLVKSAYNKISYGKERIHLVGSATEATGSQLSRQYVSEGEVKVERSRFLSGKTGPQRAKNGAPGAPSAITLTYSGSGTAFLTTQTFYYKVTGENEIGEGASLTSGAATVDGNYKYIRLDIEPAASGNAPKFYNVYRTAAGGAAATAKFVGRVVNSGTGHTYFYDLGNKLPGFVTGYLVQSDTMELAELAPFSSVKLAQTDLSEPMAHFRFVCLKCFDPRKSVLIDNLVGSTGVPQFQTSGAFPA